jgi:hypothetical protein
LYGFVLPPPPTPFVVKVRPSGINTFFCDILEGQQTVVDF